MSLSLEKNFLMSDFLLTLPYPNEDGIPVVIDINRHDASRLCDLGSHKYTQVAPFIFLIRPIVKPRPRGF